MVTNNIPNFDSISYTVIEVLPFLKGQSWGQLPLAYIHGLRPSSVRLVRSSVKMDALTNRVTVYLDEWDIIEKIEQEIEVGLPEGVDDGHHLDQLSGNT